MLQFLGDSHFVFSTSLYSHGFQNATFMELALEGERRCKKGDCRAGVAFLEEAVNKPDAPEKSDSRTLSAIYR